MAIAENHKVCLCGASNCLGQFYRTKGYDKLWQMRCSCIANILANLQVIETFKMLQLKTKKINRP